MAGSVAAWRGVKTTAAVCLCWLVSTAAGAFTLDSRFDTTLQAIQERSPYKYVRDVILAAEGETRIITCSFDSLYTAGKHWKRTFYSPVAWYSYYTDASETAAEEPITDGKVLHFPGGKVFAYKLINPMSVAPSSLLVLENVPMQLSGTYFICKTNLQPGSVQAFYLKVVKPVLYAPSAGGGGRVQAKLGDRAKLDCQGANNFPMTSVYWSRRRKDEKLAASQPVLAWGPTYELSGITMETAQYFFTCHVNNHLDPEWTVSFRIELINGTKTKPGPITATYNGVRSAFRGRSSQAVPQYQSTYTVSCRVQGDGVRFRWLRNGTELSPYADPNLYTYSSSMGGQHFTDLILKKFRSQDRGVYECVAENEVGGSSFVFDLESVGTPPSPPRPPQPPPPQTLDTPGPGGDQRHQQRQQQQLGSGWDDPPGAGSGDFDLDDGPDDPRSPAAAAASVVPAAASGDHRPPLGRARVRVRRHWKKKRLL